MRQSDRPCIGNNFRGDVIQFNVLIVQIHTTLMVSLALRVLSKITVWCWLSALFFYLDKQRSGFVLQYENDEIRTYDIGRISITLILDTSEGIGPIAINSNGRVGR